MNLSALNPPPVNPLTGPVAEPNGAGQDAARSKNTALSGADFASYLHNQVQSLKQAQRPNIAASAKPLPPVHAKHDPRVNPEKPDKAPNSVKAKSPAQTAGPQRHANDDAKADTADNSKDAANSKHTTAGVRDPDTTDSDRTPTDAVAEKDALSDDTPNSPGDNTDIPTAASDATDTLAHTDTASATATDNSANTVPAPAQPPLTTIAVSENLQIITSANSTASEQSVADFALAMGLDPNQVKNLFGESAANAAAQKLANVNPSTQQILGIHSLPSFRVGMDTAVATTPSTGLNAGDVSATQTLSDTDIDRPVSTADFQAIHQLSATAPSQTQNLWDKMGQLQIQMGAAAAQNTAASTPVSTLAVLSMMDSQLREQDIESLKTEFDALSSFDVLPAAGHDTPALTLPGLANRPVPAHSNPVTTPVFANHPDLAQTYDTLSQKLATELAGRMHEKLNAGEWKMKFALKPASLGLVDVQLEMRDGKLSAHFQSDTHLTQDLLQNGSQRLKDALADLGMNNASVFVEQGNQRPGQGSQGQSNRSGPFTQDGDNRGKLSDESGPKIADNPLPRRDQRSQFDSYA